MTACFAENGQEMHGKIADIGFMDGAARDLRLRAASPGTDAGRIVALPEFGWRQAYSGAAPDVGAYEGGELVEGPPFRFREPPEGKPAYREKSRIVRHGIEKNAVILDFSDALDSSSVKKDGIMLYRGETPLRLVSVSFPNPYRVVLKTESMPASGALSLQFQHLPRGINGEEATYWASTVRIR